MMKGLQKLLAKLWLPSLLGVIGTAVTLSVLFFRLGSLTPGLSSQELQALANTTSLKTIAQNPLYLPFLLGEWMVFRLHLNHLPIALRGVSALIGSVCVLGFYMLLKRWHTRRIAITGTLVFLCSTWFLSITRSATPTILYVFNVLSIVFIGALVHQQKASKSSLLLAAICAALLVYSPGMVWLLIIGVVWQYKGIISLLKQNPVWLWLTASIIFGILLLPAIYAVGLHWRYALDILAIPQHPEPIKMAWNLLLVPKELFVQGPDQEFWLAKLPIMDMFLGVMFAVGVYNYYRRRKLTRTKFLAEMSVVLILLIAILNIPSVVMLPLVYAAVVAGLTLLLQQWFTVFPLNPIARNVGLGILLIVTLASCSFQLNRYFVAWRYNATTRAVYSNKLTQ